MNTVVSELVFAKANKGMNSDSMNYLIILDS